MIRGSRHTTPSMVLWNEFDRIPRRQQACGSLRIILQGNRRTHEVIGTLVTCARRGSVSGLETFSDIGASAAHVAE